MNQPLNPFLIHSNSFLTLLFPSPLSSLYTHEYSNGRSPSPCVFFPCVFFLTWFFFLFFSFRLLVHTNLALALLVGVVVALVATATATPMVALLLLPSL